MADAPTPAGPTPRANLFPATIFRPQVAVSNFSNKPSDVVVSLSHTSGGKTATEIVQKFMLLGHSSRSVDITAHGDFAMTNSIVVGSNLSPGEVIAQFAAWGDSSVREIELQGKDAASRQNGGGHPWDIRNGATSTLFLFSHGSDVTKKIDVQISSGAAFWWKTYSLAPMETKAISINDILNHGIRDDQGRQLPRDLTRGQVAWFAGFPKWGKGRLMLSRPAEGLARSFSCGTCVTDCNFSSLSPHSSITIAVGGKDYLGDIVLKTCSISCTEQGCGTKVLGPTTPSTTVWSPAAGTSYYTGQPATTRFTATGTSAGTGSESFNTRDDAGAGNSCWSGGDGSITVQAPTYLYATGMSAANNSCQNPTPWAGVAGSVHYQVLDQNGNQIAVAGMSPQEQLTVGGKVVQTYANFSTPVTTAADGLFDDVPVGACFSQQPPPNTEVCGPPITQNFQVIYNGKTYRINTVTTQLECWDGVRVTATGNPTGKNFSYTLGTP